MIIFLIFGNYFGVFLALSGTQEEVRIDHLLSLIFDLLTSYMTPLGERPGSPVSAPKNQLGKNEKPIRRKNAKNAIFIFKNQPGADSLALF